MLSEQIYFGNSPILVYFLCGDDQIVNLMFSYLVWETLSLLGVVISSWTSSTRKSFWQTNRRKSALWHGHDADAAVADDDDDDDDDTDDDDGIDDEGAVDDDGVDDDDDKPAILDCGFKQCESQQSGAFSLYHCSLEPD